MIRSVLAVIAAGWFAYNAALFLPEPWVRLNDGAPGGIDGDDGAVAVIWAARVLFAGLAVLSLAIVEWRGVEAAFRSSKDTHERIA